MTPTDPSQDAPFWGVHQAGPRSWEAALWAPSARAVALRLGDTDLPMERDASGTHRLAFTADAGTPYRFVVDGTAHPDPASRRQQGDVHGPSLLTPRRSPPARRPRPWHQAVIYEMHVGTFTTEGTFAAAAQHMDGLAALGLTAVEVMPIAQFAGDRGWGYDGVLPYAPHPAYGTPDDFAAFVKAAHAAGLMVILDVVYNHFGPEGSYIGQIAPEFFTPKRHTPWGPAIDFAQPAVRDYVTRNALMWVQEFGVDGLRIDAVHELRDDRVPDILTELGHLMAAQDPPVHVIAEDDRNRPDWRDAGAVTANWNDDFHHAVHCLLTGESESYYAPFAVDPMADLVAALEAGHVEQGQPRPPRETPRGAPSGHLQPTAFVNANQTHDQVGNRAQGERLLRLADPSACRIVHALLLSAPYIPMLFMGEEAGSRAPFLFFADFHGKLGRAVQKGRTREFAQFESFGGKVPDPLAPQTFADSRPFARPAPDAEDWRDLTRRLLQLRARRIAPLLATPLQESSATRTADRSLRASWRFEAGTLEVHANLGTPSADAGWPEVPDLALGTPDEPLAFAVRIAP